jgi:hypothetical protein
MPGAGQDSHTIVTAVVLATIVVAFRRAIIRAVITIFAVVMLVLLGAGAMTLFATMHQ